MATGLKLYVNSTNTEQDILTLGTGDDLWIEIDLALDKLIWSEGSAAVIDDADEPTSDELNEAAMLIEAGSDNPANYCFLYDASQLKLKLIDNAAGNGLDKQYAFGFEFDGATASEPTLEAWDTNAHATNNLHCLGNGTGANSFFKAVATKTASPGVDWAGTPISGASNKLNLNEGSGALGGADRLYANIKVVVPAAYGTAAAETPVLTVRYTWN